MRQIFRDPEQQAAFDAGGFAFHDFLDQRQIEGLRDVYFRTAGAGHQTYEFAQQLTYYISVFDKNSENRRVANDGIRSLFEESIDDVLIDYRILYCNFMVKAPNAGEIQAHQDYTWVDESRHVAFNLWVPLQDTDLGNGCFHLIPGSHRFFPDSHRAASIANSLVQYNEPLKPYMVPTPLRAGRGIVFDHRLFHYSPDNLSGEPRVAAQLVLIPREAQPVMAYYDSEHDPDHVRLLEIPSDEFLLDHNLWEDPPDALRVVDTRPYRALPSETAVIDTVRRHVAVPAKPVS